jgi:hypothetical protein
MLRFCQSALGRRIFYLAGEIGGDLWRDFSLQPAGSNQARRRRNSIGQLADGHGLDSSQSQFQTAQAGQHLRQACEISSR